MNKDEKTNRFPETANNTLPKGADYDVFSENTRKDLNNAEGMNRDYLKHIYKEDMDFLNKDVRMTRTQYLQSYDSIETTFKKEKSFFKKLIVVLTVILVIAVTIGILCFFEYKSCCELYRTAYAGVALGKGKYSNIDVQGLWGLCIIYGTFGCASTVLGISQFFFFGYGYFKKLKHLEKNRNKALQTLENRKKEAMILGQYDASK
ncbi:MAG: hypothetical protein J1F37_03570 [Oscillospiraceae bacterium]|nr:hypothetical protein [Oscillospiraceae bacterium]